MMMHNAEQILNVLRCNNQDNNQYKYHSKEFGIIKAKKGEIVRDRGSSNMEQSKAKA